MHQLPHTSIATRLNAFIAAVVVTLTLAVGIDRMASSEGGATQMAVAAKTQPV